MAELVGQYAAAVGASYRPDLARENAAQLEALYRNLAETRGVAHDPQVAAKLSGEMFAFWGKVAVSQAAAHPNVIRAKMALDHDLFRKQVAEHPVAFYLTPVRELFAIVVFSPLTSLALLLGSVGLGGLSGLGLAELYLSGHLILKILAGMLALTAMWVWFPAMKFFGLCDVRGWMALVSHAGAAVTIALDFGAKLHWPWWGGPLVGMLFIVAGLVNQPPSVFGVAGNPYPAPTPTLDPPGVGMLPPTPPR